MKVDYTYCFDEFGRLDVNINCNGPEILIPGRLSEDSSMFFANSKAILSCEYLSPKEGKEMMKSINRMSSNGLGPIIIFE